MMNADVPEPNGPDWANLFVDTLVDAALYIADEDDARDDIESAVASDAVVPTRYHYSSDSLARRWIRRSADDTYRYQRNTVNYWSSRDGKEFADIVRKEMKCSQFDFVSLGPGDGRKDAELILNWLSAGVDLLYYPYDVSLPLAAHAVRRVRQRAEVIGRGHTLPVKAVIADFHYLQQVRTVFEHRSSPNVISFLGTLGNLNNDVDYLRRLHEAMGDQDLLMLEVRLKSEADLKQLTPDSGLQHDFGPLEYYFGLPFYRKDERGDRRRLVEPAWHTDISLIDQTSTIVVTYDGPFPNLDSDHHQIKLQYIHMYDPDIFLRTMTDDLDFEVVHTFKRNPTFLECLLRRAQGKPQDNARDDTSSATTG